MTAARARFPGREEDAAFFEDWSEWASLDGRPRRPPYRIAADGVPVPVGPRTGWCRYWLIPDIQIPGFHIRAASASIRDVIRAIPGARRRPRDRYDVSERYWIVPARSWRALRAELPRIKRMTLAYVRAHEADR